jgi:hypothetical protein
MYCSQCGSNNDPAARHCNQCGAALSPQVLQPAAQAAPPMPAPAQTAYNIPFSTPGAPLPPGTVPNYMVQSILVTLCCCLPLGIVGIIRAGDVNKRLAVGDYDGALQVSKSIRTLLWVGFAVGLVVSLIYLVIGIVKGLSDSGAFNQ